MTGNGNQYDAEHTEKITWMCWSLNWCMYRKTNNIPNPSGAPGMEDRSWVNEYTVPIGTTAISLHCRKPKKTVTIVIRQIMRVTIPIDIKYEVNTCIEVYGKR